MLGAAGPPDARAGTFPGDKRQGYEAWSRSAMTTRGSTGMVISTRTQRATQRQEEGACSSCTGPVWKAGAQGAKKKTT